MNDMPDMNPVDEQAAFWLFRSEFGLSPQEEAEFAAWLSASDAHLDAWERGLAALDDIGRDDDPLIAAMRVDALTARPAATGRMRTALIGLAAMLVFALVGVGSWHALAPPAGVTGAAPVTLALNAAPAFVSGDTPRTVALPDGSVATLDRDTALALTFGPAERALRVLRGRAAFDVTHDGRAFAVSGRDVTVTATGTRFSVQLRSDGVVAMLQRGRVVVDRAGDPATVTLAPGQSLVAIAGQPFAVSAVDAATMLDWAVDYLAFHDTPLDQAVAQLNARNVTKLRVVGSAARLLVSGRFRADDPDGFVLAVTQVLAVKRRTGRDGVVELVAR